MANIKALKLFLQALFLILYLPSHFCLETDTINSTLSIKDPDFIVSRNKTFKLGFFTPDNTTNRYLAIFYVVSERTAIWIANRENPLTDSSGTVTISRDGNLVLMNGRNNTVWSTNATSGIRNNTTALLQDTGNLVLQDISTGNVIWESFSYPSHAFVPGMKLIDDTNTGNRVVLSSWISKSNPEVGHFTLGLRALNIPEMLIWRDGETYWRSGPWNELAFLGIHYTYTLYNDQHRILNESGVYYITTHVRTNFLMRYDLNSTGALDQSMWSDSKKRWDSIWLAIQNECDIYAKCGPFTSCNVQDSPVCSCLKGFEPFNKNEWRNGNWTGGCVRKTQLECNQRNDTGNGDGFLKLQSMKVPDFAERYPARQVDECMSICFRNCSCLAYAHDSTIGCMIWRERLVDIQQLSGPRPDLFIRLAASELGDDHKDKKLVIIIPVIVGFVCVSLCGFMVCCWMRKRKGEFKKEDQKTSEAKLKIPPDSTAIVVKDESEKVDIKELPLFTFATLAHATNQFHDDNLLGRGGFGSVYLGKLADGREIGVKRLSAASGQGAEEFMNEVIVISKLQHRNLVRLIGCCVENEEKMLIYEYMPNKSLDVCLFDPSRPSQTVLDWEKRLSIIEGIGRGLIYLHRDSRLRIIHRDLKPSNVLLDEDWNPKISDFGMARIFGGDQDQANTARVVGTYGYMAPEYAMEGRFSEKSDVYSFGVLMLEIVSGKKNTHYYNQEWSLSLLGCAWKLWNEDNAMAFVDQMIASSNFHEEMVRCIHIGLLCVQEFPKDRPTIQTVLSMLSGEIMDLPLPEQPVFAEKWNRFHVGSTQSTSQNGYSVNELTVTVLDGR